MMKQILKYIILFSIGGLLYCGIEMLWRGRTHWTMFFVGGLCFTLCGSINEILDWQTPLWKQMLICATGITLIEFISGVIINIVLKLNVWDYSHLPLNICGQVCLLYSFFWFILSCAAIVLDDWLRYWLFKEEKPHYIIF